MITDLPHHTSRLTLQTLRTSDLKAFLSYRSRADVAELQGWSPMSEEEARDFLAKENSDIPLETDSWRQIGIAMSDGDTLIGGIEIHLYADERTAEFGLSLHPDRQGLGFGTEAAQALIALFYQHTSVDRDARNTSCIRLLTKAGMHHLRSGDGTQNL